MAMDIPAIREIVERVCTRPDVLDACKRRDLAFVIAVLGKHGVTQDQIGALAGKTQGRISEYMTGKRNPTLKTLEGFADGLGMPAVARRALGLAPATDGSGQFDLAAERAADIAGSSPGDVQPLISNLSRASAVPVLAALREIHHGYL
jgi:transcriptional regulator with XRE-family HTH domain